MEQESSRAEPPDSVTPAGADAPEPYPGLPKRRQVIHVIILDVLILVELGFAVYCANAVREEYDFTLVFCAVFFGLVIPTIFLSRAVMRRLEQRTERTEQAPPLQ